MKVWDDKDASLGYWDLFLDGRKVVSVNDRGDFYSIRTLLGGETIRTSLDKKSAEEPADRVKLFAEQWYADTLKEYLVSLEKAKEQCRSELAALKEDQIEKLVDIFDMEYDGEGYLHFRVLADSYALEGLYRLYDPTNGPDMTLVSIDYGYMHPIIERQWDRIEEALYDASLKRYHGILDKSEAFKEKVLNAMEAAGYTYDVIESYDGWHRFMGEGGVTMGFDNLREAAEWLEGVVFEDDEVSRAVEGIMHPERRSGHDGINDVLADAAKRSVEASQGDAGAPQGFKDLGL